MKMNTASGLAMSSLPLLWPHPEERGTDRCAQASPDQLDR
jgi:hypothetical protein